MKKLKKNLISVLLLITIISVVSFAGGIDFKKYISEKSYVMHFSYNTLNKSDNSFTHNLRFYDYYTYKVMVLSSNPDITITIMDSAGVMTLKTMKTSIKHENYYLFTIEQRATKNTMHRIKVKANKSEEFEYYFLATYEASEAQKNQTLMIDYFDKFSKSLFEDTKIVKDNKTYSKKLIGFLYFPSPQTNWRYLYQNNIFMAQSFTMDKDHTLSFYEGGEKEPSKKKNIKIQVEPLGADFEKFNSKYFITSITKDRSLYTIELSGTGPSILISQQLFEEKLNIASEIILTKPIPQKTDKMSVNLAGYVSNWKKDPKNFVTVKRINGNDEAKFRLEQNIVGSVFGFDLNVPLIPGKNRLIIEATINGEKITLEKTVIAEAQKKSLLVELTWDTPTTDLDLYVVKPDGEVVCFENQNEGKPTKGWLDIDAKNGYGPERFRMDNPLNGGYKIYAHYYNGDAKTNVYAKVINNEKIIELKGKVSESNKTNSSLGTGPDWLLLGEIEIK